MSTQTILIRGARQLLTMRGALGPRRGEQLRELGMISDGALLIRDGVILQAGPSSRVEALAEARDAVEINARGRVVMPGFVDSHTHAIFPLPVPAGGPPREPAHAVRVLLATTAQRLARHGRGYLDAMARHGTTTMEAKTGCGSVEAAETKVLRVLRVLHTRPIDVIPTFLFRHLGDGACGQGLSDLMANIRRRNLARFADVWWDGEPRLGSLYRSVLETARSLGFACKIHAGGSLVAEAVAAAADCAATSIDHLDHLAAEDAPGVAASSAVVTLLPAGLFRGGPVAPARALINAGAAIALGTDYNPGQRPILNMQSAIALACLGMGIGPAEAITAATVNGAYALGCANRAGLLAVDKPADVLILNVSDYRELGRTLGVNLVHMTMKRGEVIYQEGAVGAPGAEEA